MGALPTNRETTAMPETLVRTDFDLALDVLCDLAPQITFDGQIGVDVLTDLDDLTVGEIANLGAPIDIEIIENMVSSRVTDTKDVGKTDFNTFVSGKVGSGNTSHLLPLTLLVTRV
jgi:hypothetical protein